mmetsp:Transcript_7327/g.14563  ORF Transcript_7327/g.14563 Transcript_7327/m.14563 type:complete len:331 (+) Transcript_7327:152-1144(+)
MTRDTDFSVPDTQSEASVALSDKTLLAVSIAGFIVLATTVYFVLIRPNRSADELDGGVGGGGINYEEELDHADVRTLNRAQRRARARNRMKRNRRIDPRFGQQHHHGEGQGEDGAQGAGDGEADPVGELDADADAAEAAGRSETDDNDHRQDLSRKERAKLAKAAEREERRLYERERQDARKQAEAAAAAERKEREKDREASALEEKRRRVLEAQERERAEHQEWIMLFVNSSCSESTVKDFIGRAKQRKIWPIDDIAREYGVSPKEAESRIERLILEERFFGIVSNGMLVFIEPNEMKLVADFIKRNGDTSLSTLSKEICRIVSKSLNA